MEESKGKAEEQLAHSTATDAAAEGYKHWQKAALCLYRHGLHDTKRRSSKTTAALSTSSRAVVSTSRQHLTVSSQTQAEKACASNDCTLHVSCSAHPLFACQPRVTPFTSHLVMRCCTGQTADGRSTRTATVHSVSERRISSEQLGRTKGQSARDRLPCPHRYAFNHSASASFFRETMASLTA